jgi:iron complex outermembrane recepter protein
VRNPTRFDRSLRLDAAALPAGALGAGTPATLIRWYGNQAFDSETSVAYEAGWRSRLHQSVSVDLSGFVQHYRRGLEAVPSGTFLPEQSGQTSYLVWRWDLLNQRPATAYGAELALVYAPTEQMRVSAGYSLVRVESGGLAGGVNTSAVENTTPRHTAYVDWQTQLGRRWELGAGLRYFSRTAALPVPAVLAPELRLQWRPRPGLTVLLRGENLADPRHPELDSRTGQPVSEIARRILCQISWEK